jgi:hypothetical protein
MMWPRNDPDRWDATVAQTHDVLAYVEFLVDGDPVLSTADGDVRLQGGTVKIAAGAIRRQVDLTLTDLLGDDGVTGLLTPVVEKGLIIPGLSEVRVWAGIRYWDWTQGDVAAGTDVEYVPVFTGPVMSYDLEDYPQVKLSCSDRMAYVQRPFSAPFTMTAGITLDTGIEKILRAKVPPAKLEMNMPTTELTTKLLVYDEQADPADKVRELGTAAGWTVYVDPMGVFQAADEPELVESQIVFTYQEGPGGALILPALSGSIQNVVNTWVVTGESPTTSINPYGKATDVDPNSPTYVRGSFDEYPRFISLPVLTSDAACRLAARTYRRREGGISDSLRARVFPNPALEKGDVIAVTGGLVDRLMICDAFELELTGSAQTITARAGVATDDN